MQMKIQPKCWPNSKIPMGPAMTSFGWIAPCCWLLSSHDINNNVHDLFNENLKITNVNSLDDIFESKQWKEFHRMLEEEPENMCQTCKVMCGSPKK